MNRRLHILLIVLIWLVASDARPARAQLRKLLFSDEANSQDVEVKLASGSVESVAKREREALRERQQALIAAAPDLDAWRAERDKLLLRLEEVRGLRVSIAAQIAAEEEAVAAREAARIKVPEALEDEGPPPGTISADARDGSSPDIVDAGSTAPAADVVEPSDTATADALPVDATGDAAASLPVTEPEPEPEIPRTHPAYLQSLVWLEAVLEQEAAELQRLITNFGEQRELVAQGIAAAGGFLERYQERAGEEESGSGGDGGAPVPLARARTIHYDLYLARLELSLARSRSQSLVRNGEFLVDGESTDLPPVPPEPVLPEYAGTRMQETYDLARAVRDEADQRVRRLSQLIRDRQGAQRQRHTVRSRVAQIDVIAKQQRVDWLERDLDTALDRIFITQEELEEWRERYRLWEPRIQKDIERVQRQLEELRAQPVAVGTGEYERFSRTHAREMTVTALQEELAYHELRAERLRFVDEAYANLNAILDGEAPDEGFVRRYRRILDEDELKERQDELSRRREAWRRQHLELSKEKAPPGRANYRKQVLDGLGSILELCTSQEYVIESEGRLAHIVRYHLQRYERESRSGWWYFVRILFSLAIFAVAVVMSILIGRAAIRMIQRLVAQVATEGEAQTQLPAWRGALRSTQRTAIFGFYFFGVLFVWIGAAFLAVQLAWGVELGLDRIGDVMTAPLFLVGDTQITAAAFLKLIAAILVAVIVARLTQSFLKRQVFQFFNWDEGVRHAVSVVLRYIVLFVGVALGLEYVGIGLGAFAVLLGVIGIGIGFGLQNIANNFISGFIILFERPVKKGDFVIVGDLEGEVQRISARATTVRTRDNVSVIIPNSQFISEQVVNWSHDDPRIRIRVPVGVAYGSDTQKVERILLEAAKRHPSVLSYPRPEAQFKEFGDSSLNFELLCWTSAVRQRFVIVSDLNKDIDRRFREEGVEIPFPQRDLHLRSAIPLPVTAPAPVQDEKDE